MKYLLAAACSLCTLSCFSQLFPSKDYPRDYFRNPLGIPMSLAANFGELRPNHYHMGLDIRTQKRVNLPVFAAADGYIAHVKIEPEGFGQAIYIRHPNGYTTLYAHLNRFIPALAAYVQQQQYKLESWQVFLDIPPGLFPVKKGDLIAYSGSTGGSEGPHLHFEIRRSSDDVNLNPLLFGLPVPDHTAPTILRLAVYDRGRSVYEQTPRIFPVHRDSPAGPGGGGAAATPALRSDGAPQGALPPGGSPAVDSEHAIRPAISSYTVGAGPVIVGFSKVSFAISAFDTQDGSANPNGIYQAVLEVDGLPVSGFQMDQISYDHTRNINAHVDYKTRAAGGPFLQHLSELPGYPAPSIYRPFPHASGVVDLSDGSLHFIRAEVQDTYGNVAALAFVIQYRQASEEGHAGGGPRDAAAGNDPTAVAAAGKEFYPGMLDGMETDDCAFYIPERGVYDSVRIGYAVSGPSLPGGVSAVHRIGFPWIPLESPFLVRIRPDRELSGAARDKVVMVRWAGDKKDVERPEWKDGWASAWFREFGSFQLVEDEEAPVIMPIGFRDGAMLNHSSRIAFRVKDNLGVILSCRAELDPPAAGGPGKWLCFTNDKGLAYIYTFDGHCPPGEHVLRITAEDEAGNSTTKEYHFTR